MFDSLQLEVEDYERLYFNCLRAYAKAHQRCDIAKMEDLIVKIKVYGEQCGRDFMGFC